MHHAETESDPGDESGRPGADAPVRVGDTLRRPQRPNSVFVQRVLLHLEDSGVSWSPRALGIDEWGREVVSWISGAVASTGAEVDLAALAHMVRELHDRSVELAEGSECVIHDDLQPRNVVVEHTRPVGLIDWEQARPGRRVEDVANLCWSFVEPTPTSDPVEIARRWRFVVDAYSLEDRESLVPTVVSRMVSSRGRHRAQRGRGVRSATAGSRSWVTIGTSAPCMRGRWPTGTSSSGW